MNGHVKITIDGIPVIDKIFVFEAGDIVGFKRVSKKLKAEFGESFISRMEGGEK